MNADLMRKLEHMRGLATWHAHQATLDAAIAALSAPQGDDKTILKELRPSKKAMEKIDRIAQANAAGMAALRDMPLGSAAPQGEVEREALRREIINSPETADFMAGVPIEAAHQRERWGADHDAGKTPVDWFWLIGYLAQKAANSSVKGDTEKALHHTISTAAALANWHAALSGADTAMRPGILPPMTVRDKIATDDGSHGHHCHWPGCDKTVPPATWGCRKHWYMLPAALRSLIWRTFRPGQEETKTPSREYVDAARKVQEWIARKYPPAPQ